MARGESVLDYARFVLSGLLTLLSTILVTAALFTGQTMFWEQVPGVVAFFIFVIDLVLLGILEGLQIALVELKKLPTGSYRDTHPRAYAVGTLAFKGDNCERFLIGRQLCVVMLVFLAAKGSTLTITRFLVDIPHWIQQSMMVSGMFGVVVTVVFAQLCPQIIAAKYPVQFMAVPGMGIVLRFTLIVESFGIAHLVWLLLIIVRKSGGLEASDDEETHPGIAADPEKVTRGKTPLDFVRYVFSFLCVTGSVMLVMSGIFRDHTQFWTQVPHWAILLIFVVCLVGLFVLEGLQIALVELKKQHPESYARSHPRAYDVGILAFDGDNCERFLIGRQICVVILVFMSAKITTLDMTYFIGPLPVWFQEVLLQSGLFGAVIVLVFAQLAPQIIAAKYPVQFMNVPGMKVVLYTTLFLESTGLAHLCWLLLRAFRKVRGFENDSDDIDLVVDDDASDIEHRSSGRSNSSGDLALGASTAGKGRKDRYGRSGFAGGRRTTRTRSLSPRRRSMGVEMDADERLAEVFNRFKLVLENQTVDDVTALAFTKHLDRHPELYRQFPSMIGGKAYAAPQQIADQMAAEGYEVPAFLLPISDPNHVPPHIVACQLMGENYRLRYEMSRVIPNMTLEEPAEDFPLLHHGDLGQAGINGAASSRPRKATRPARKGRAVPTLTLAPVGAKTPDASPPPSPKATPNKAFVAPRSPTRPISPRTAESPVASERKGRPEEDSDSSSSFSILQSTENKSEGVGK